MQEEYYHLDDVPSFLVHDTNWETYHSNLIQSQQQFQEDGYQFDIVDTVTEIGYRVKTINEDQERFWTIANWSMIWDRNTGMLNQLHRAEYSYREDIVLSTSVHFDQLVQTTERYKLSGLTVLYCASLLVYLS